MTADTSVSGSTPAKVVATETPRITGLPPSSSVLRDAFLLDPRWTFLDHASHGACARPVLESYQRLQLEFEINPGKFMQREYRQRLAATRDGLAEYLSADPGGLVLLSSPMVGRRAATAALELAPGDEILTTHHDTATHSTSWRATCAHQQLNVITAQLPDPLTNPAEVLTALEESLTDRTRAVFMTHLGGVTSAVLPVELIAGWATERGLLCVIDGTHAVGQLPVNLADLPVDAYIGSCDRWLGAPKGSAFIWIKASLREQFFAAMSHQDSDVSLTDPTVWCGPGDPIAVLGIPAALAFQARCRWPAVRERSNSLAVRFHNAVTAECSGGILYSGPEWYRQMVSVSLPWPSDQTEILQQRLSEDHCIEAAVFPWQDRTLLRASFQGYNSGKDCDSLIAALAMLLST